MPKKINKEWMKVLDSEQYMIMREEGTERAGSSDLNYEKRKGFYICAGCETKLFSSEMKYDSGSGWPSFTQPVKANAIAYHSDHSFGRTRIETTCNTCEAHLGHVFPDGPAPSGLRYCMNAVALCKLDESETQQS